MGFAAVRGRAEKATLVDALRIRQAGELALSPSFDIELTLSRLSSPTTPTADLR